MIVDYLKDITRKVWRCSTQRENTISTLAVGSNRFVSLTGRPETKKDNSDPHSPVRSRPTISIEGIGVGLPHGLDSRGHCITDKTEATRSICHAISQARRMAGRKKTAPKGVSLFLTVCGSAKPPKQPDALKKALQESRSVTEENQIYVNQLMDCSLAEQVISCIHSLEAEVKDVVFEPYSVGKAILTSKEKAEGVAIIDMGKMFTDLAIYRQSHISYANSIPIGGKDIDRAIGESFEIEELEEAGYVKHEVGTLNISPTNIDKEVSPIRVHFGADESPKTIDFLKTARIIRSEVENILDAVFADLGQNTPHSGPPEAVVLTGNSSLIEGLVPFIRDRYGVPARRRSVPPGFSGLAHALDEPRYHCSLGLLRYGSQYGRESSRRLKSREVG